MAFSETTKDIAYKRADGRCECHRGHTGNNSAPHNGGRCSRTFTRHGGQWHAHHINANGGDELSNCEVLCIACHELTGTYGG